jgi:hypothetical protein
MNPSIVLGLEHDPDADKRELEAPDTPCEFKWPVHLYCLANVRKQIFSQLRENSLHSLVRHVLSLLC